MLNKLCFVQIILGGGRQVFEAANVTERTAERPCKRGDNLDLIEAWKKDKKSRNNSHVFLENREGLLNTNLEDKDYVLGFKKLIKICKEN